MSTNPTPVEDKTVTYWAISFFSSRTVWLGFWSVVAGILALPEVIAFLPLRYTPVILAVVGFLVMYLRTQTVRPVAFISPGDSIPVEVKRVGPPDPPLVSD